MFFLDTDHISILDRKPQPAFGLLSARMALHPPTNLLFSAVSFHEQVMGIHSYINRARRNQEIANGYGLLNDLIDLYADAQVLGFDIVAAAEFDSLRARKVRIATMDLRIASIAVTRNLTVLTRNMRDFTKVPGLKIEDWTI
jgi:tRNA(fMet)-specific endonuclease VapC